MGSYRDIAMVVELGNGSDRIDGSGKMLVLLIEVVDSLQWYS